LLDIVGRRYWYFLLSLIIIVPGTIFLITSGLQLGVDFTGGTEFTVQMPQSGQANKLSTTFSSITNSVSYVQPVIGVTCPGKCQYIIRTKQVPQNQIDNVTALVQKQFGTKAQVISHLSVSGTIASQTTRQAVIAVAAAAIAILAYISFAFRKAPNPFRFGVAALIAMLHDVLVVLGIFAILGKVAHVEVDSTFVTAMLTIIGFSVHDTIVIFDRIRENLARRTGQPFAQVVNFSILQSFVRSINTSFTVVLTLLAVFLFTGEAIRYFVLAMLIGIISGTYSSIFNASQILVVWHNHEVAKFLRRDRPTPTVRAA
jgi:preprotein translocase subunit SecF